MNESARPGYIFEWVCPLCEIEVSGSAAEVALHVIDSHLEEYQAGALGSSLPVRAVWVIEESAADLLYKLSGIHDIDILTL